MLVFGNMGTQKKREIKNAAAFLPLFLAISFVVFLLSRSSMIDKAAKNAPELSQEQESLFYAKLDAAVPERRAILRPLPYKAPKADFELNAESAILLDEATGFVLYEKNADQVIPPASMTKLFLIECALEKVREGKASLSDIIPLGPESWASNAPPRSSLMFLGKGQIVTLEELLTGLSVASGNDAAAAIASALFGTMDEFLKDANNLVLGLGLQKTVIAEPSGYSEKNMTTPREMASFCRLYIKRFPDAIKKFHSMKTFTYPKEQNLPPEQRGRAPQNFSNGIPDEIWTPFEFENTNKLVGVLPGCDGIKTGYIDESGYNLALTTKRGGQRFISVTMRGSGKSRAEGDANRFADGTKLQEWAHKNFQTYDAAAFAQTEFIVPLYGSQKTFARLLASDKGGLCVPKDAKIVVKTKAPKYLFGKIDFGAAYGSLEIYDGERLLQEIPLVAVESAAAANQFIQRCDEIILRLKGERK